MAAPEAYGLYFVRIDERLPGEGGALEPVAGGLERLSIASGSRNGLRSLQGRLDALLRAQSTDLDVETHRRTPAT